MQEMLRDLVGSRLPKQTTSAFELSNTARYPNGKKGFVKYQLTRRSLRIPQKLSGRVLGLNLCLIRTEESLHRLDQAAFSVRV